MYFALVQKSATERSKREHAEGFGGDVGWWSQLTLTCLWVTVQYFYWLWTPGAVEKRPMSNEGTEKESFVANFGSFPRRSGQAGRASSSDARKSGERGNGRY